MPTRLQLSLFVPQDVRADIESVRRVVDPVQHRLIPAHVTLCREDELGGLPLSAVQERVSRASPGRLTLHFGPPERFGEHGILLPCVDGTDEFLRLRRVVLGSPHVRPHAPHLTLAHPRNPKADGNDLGSAATFRDGRRITFEEISLIEQIDDAPWTVRGIVPLLAPADGADVHVIDA